MYPAYSTLKINIRFSYYCALFKKFGPFCAVSLAWLVFSLFCHLTFYLPLFFLFHFEMLQSPQYCSDRNRTSLHARSPGELWSKRNIVAALWYSCESETSSHSHHNYNQQAKSMACTTPLNSLELNCFIELPREPRCCKWMCCSPWSGNINTFQYSTALNIPPNSFNFSGGIMLVSLISGEGLFSNKLL